MQKSEYKVNADHPSTSFLDQSLHFFAAVSTDDVTVRRFVAGVFKIHGHCLVQVYMFACCCDMVCGARAVFGSAWSRRRLQYPGARGNMHVYLLIPSRLDP